MSEENQVSAAQAHTRGARAAQRDAARGANAPASRRPATAAERQARKQRVLSQGQSSVTRGIAEAVVIKDGNLFFLCARDGSVPLHGDHGFGLYYHDCRYLHSYALQLAGTEPTRLIASAAEGTRAVLELTNADLHVGRRVIPKETVGLTWERRLDGAQRALRDQLVFKNFGLLPADLPVTLCFGAGFEDIFTVRALLDEHPGQLQPPAWQNGVLAFAYDGADGLLRRTRVEFAPRPERQQGTTAHFTLHLDARATQRLDVTLTVSETPQAESSRPPADGPAQSETAETRAPGLAGRQTRWTEVTSDSLLLNRLLQRSAIDLAVLRSQIGDERFFAAGIPWFGTLFGRDSLITALQTLAYNPQIAEETLRLLAARQGQKVDGWRDEQPGKILHELRVGELARLGEIPHTPYYGTIDATPLFLILLAEHAAWTGRLDLFAALRENVERALRWMDEYGDSDGDGYLEYRSHSEKGLVNQGWKDSGNAILNADGSPASPPIALVEAQAYAYRARLAMADLFERAGDLKRAGQLRQAAARLKERFNQQFWSEALGCYVLALQADKQPVAVVTSNPGHALWAGIADEAKARQTAQRLMADDMFNGWGVRTLSEKARPYNPIGYHLGTVWPHDNSLIAAGFRGCHCDDEAMRVITSMVEAAMYFDHYRLPELFAGYSREKYGVPAPYPVACHPQAWTAGTVPYMLQTCLGLQPRAFDRQLIVRRPLLPRFVDRVEVAGLWVGAGKAHLRFAREEDVRASAEVVGVEGELDVVIETER